MLKLTLDIFSGRENPHWILESGESAALLSEIADDQHVLDIEGRGYQGLGFRGLELEELDDSSGGDFGLPAMLRIGGGGAEDARASLDLAKRLVEARLEERLIDDLEEDFTAWALSEIELSQDHLSHRKRIDSVEEAPETVGGARGEETLEESFATRCQIEKGSFNPGFWNHPSVVGRNNCYNYATNRRTNSFAQPGRASGRWPNPMQCNRVTMSSISDGAAPHGKCVPDSEAPRWLMALVVATGHDYHWYRLSREGFWGHKPGGTPARNSDNDGRLVIDPRTASRAPYSKFCGFFYARRGMRVQ